MFQQEYRIAAKLSFMTLGLQIVLTLVSIVLSILTSALQRQKLETIIASEEQWRPYFQQGFKVIVFFLAASIGMTIASLLTWFHKSAGATWSWILGDTAVGLCILIPLYFLVGLSRR